VRGRWVAGLQVEEVAVKGAHEKQLEEGAGSSIRPPSIPATTCGSLVPRIAQLQTTGDRTLSSRCGAPSGDTDNGPTRVRS